MIGEICTCLGLSDDLMFLRISSNSCPLTLLLVQSLQAEIIIVKRLIQGHSNVTRVRVESDHSIRVVVKTTPLTIRPRRWLFGVTLRIVERASLVNGKIFFACQALCFATISCWLSAAKDGWHQCWNIGSCRVRKTPNVP